MPQAFDIGEDIAHQRKVWKVERIAWALMAGAIIAAISGFAGHGLFSKRTVTLQDEGLVVEYQRFERYHAQTQLSLQLTGAVGDETRIHIGADLLRNVEIVRIEPPPVRTELMADAATYVFDTHAAGRIIVHYIPAAPGGLQLALGRDDAPLAYVDQFVFP